MSNPRPKIALALACIISIASLAPTLATVYNPGVSTGQWVKYGNFMSRINSTNVPPDFNDTDWIRLEVIEINGKNVTFHMSGAYKNGTVPDEMGATINVETGWINTSSAAYGTFFIIAANLTENDQLPPLPPNVPMKINKTETRTYLGVSRTVNVVNFTQSTISGVDSRYFAVYDQASGILLEMNASRFTTNYPLEDYQMSFNIVDANIFTTGLTPLLDSTTYIVIAIVTIIMVIIAVLALTRKKKHTAPQPTAKTSTSQA